METIKLSRVMRANKRLRELQAEAKREREFQRRMGERFRQFAIDNYPSFVEEFTKVVNNSEYGQS